jgi:hypothetical protein
MRIYKKSIGRTLIDREELNMVEAVGEFTGKKIGPTFFRARNQSLGSGLQQISS